MSKKRNYKKIALIAIGLIGIIWWWSPKLPSFNFGGTLKQTDSTTISNLELDDNSVDELEESYLVEQLNDSIKELHGILYSYKKQLNSLKNNTNVNNKNGKNEKIYFISGPELDSLTSVLSNRYKDSIPQ